MSNFGTRPLPDTHVECPVCRGAGMVDESVHQKGPDAKSETCWGCFGAQVVLKSSLRQLRRDIEKRTLR